MLHHPSLSKNFLGDYQSLFDSSSAYLANLLGFQLLQCILAGKAQREKHSNIIRELHSRTKFAIRCVQEGHEAIMTLIGKLNALKVWAKKVVNMAIAQLEEVKRLEQSLKAFLSSI